MHVCVFVCVSAHSIHDNCTSSSFLWFVDKQMPFVHFCLTTLFREWHKSSVHVCRSYLEQIFAHVNDDIFKASD